MHDRQKFRYTGSDDDLMNVELACRIQRPVVETEELQTRPQRKWRFITNAIKQAAKSTRTNQTWKHVTQSFTRPYSPSA